MLAATGVLRGLQDTRTPLVVAVAGNALNVAAQPAARLRSPASAACLRRLGIAGSALGSVLAQVASAAALLAVVVRGARREGASLRPDLPGIRAAAHAAVAARRADAHPARRPAGHDVRRHAGRRGRRRAGGGPGHPPAGADPVDLPGLRPRRPRDRRAGDHRSLPRRRRRRRHPRGHPPDGAVGRGRRRRHRAAAGAGQPVCWARCSPPDPAVRDLLVPVLLVAALGQPVAGRGLRPRRRADRRRRRAPTSPAAGWSRWSPTRRWSWSPPGSPPGWSRCGCCSPWSSWAPGSSCSCTGPAATPGWSPAPATPAPCRTPPDAAS